MAWLGRSKNAVASLGYVPTIYVFLLAGNQRRGCPAHGQA
jgi:hypothetical protein